MVVIVIAIQDGCKLVKTITQVESLAKSNIWRFAQIMLLAGFLISGFQYCTEGNPCLQYEWLDNGVQLIW